MKRIVIAALALVAITACGGKSGTLTLNLLTSPGDDPFADAAQVRFTVGANGQHVTTVPVSMGHFSYKVSFKPDEGVISVQAQLTPNSYLFAPACKLTGGFALFIWFSQAQFVLTLERMLTSRRLGWPHANESHLTARDFTDGERICFGDSDFFSLV